MALASIVVQINSDGNTTPGSRSDAHFGNTITLTNHNNSGVALWDWTMFSQPAGSTATLSSASSSSVTFTVDGYGTYLVRLMVNNTLTDEIGIGVNTPHLAYRIPAFNESTQFNATVDGQNTAGWSIALNDALNKIDAGSGGGGGGAVSSVSNSNGSLTISPTTGAVVASLNTAHANTFSAKQTFSSHIAVDGYTVDLSSGAVAGDVVAFNGTSFVPSTNVTGPDIYWTYPAAWSTIKPQIIDRTAAGQVANVYLQDNFTNSTFIIDSAFDPSLVTFTGMNFTAQAINTVQINTAPSHMVMNFKNCEVNINTTISTAGEHLKLSLDQAYLVSLTVSPATAFDLVTPGDGYAHIIDCFNGGGIFSSNIAKMHDGGILHIDTERNGNIEAIGPDYIVTLAAGSSSANAYFHKDVTGFYFDQAHWAGAGITAHIFAQGDAFGGTYTPTTSGDWSVVPADIGTALDDLAARGGVSGTGARGQVTLWSGASSLDGYSTLTSDGSNLTIGADLHFTEDADHSILVDTPTTDTSGGNLTIKAADGYQAGSNENSGGNIYVKAGYANNNAGEGGGPYGGSLFLDAGFGHNNSSLGNIFINQDGYTHKVYCGTDLLMYSGTGPLSNSAFARTIGYGGLSADFYLNGPDLTIQGCKGGFAETSPGGPAGAGSNLYVIAGAGGDGNNIPTGGLAGPGGDIFVNAGDGGVGGDTSTLANGGSVHINGGVSGFGGVDGYVYIGDTHMRGLSFFGVTPLVGQPSSTGSTTVTVAGSGTALKADTTSTGGIGSTAYTLSDIIKHLKELGLIAQ